MNASPIITDPAAPDCGLSPVSPILTDPVAADCVTCDPIRAAFIWGQNGSSFYGYASLTGNQTIAAYLWNFGDGGTATDPDVVHTYGTGAPHVVMLTITTTTGLQRMVSGTVAPYTGTGLPPLTLVNQSTSPTGLPFCI